MDKDDIRSILEFNHWTHADLARYLLVSESAVSRWVTGKRKPALYDHVRALRILLARVEKHRKAVKA